ncbi:MAG TPA: radical SAM protein, partial [Methanotrichaceae archaeon]|nr:radical SAM protein [Methanotrichaceae archaeon]
LKSEVIKSLLRLGIKMAKGDEEVIKRAMLRDKFFRRGLSTVLEGIARYGVTVPQRLPSPFLIVWNFTNRCNLTCPHCYQKADNSLPGELSLDEKLDLVDQLDRAGVAAVALSGGEPTIHPHFNRIVEELSDRDIYASAATNGWVFSDIEKLREAVDLGLRYIEVSIDSADRSKHDKFRGMPGSWYRAVKALKNAKELEIDHGLASIMSRSTKDEIGKILDLAQSIGTTKVIFFNFVPVGRASGILDDDLSPDEREAFLKDLYIELGNRKMEVLSTAPQYARVGISRGQGMVPTAHFYAGDDFATETLAEFIGGCGAGRIYAGIGPEGTVYPCVFLPLAMGNIRDEPFRNIWDESRTFNLLRERDNFTGHCKECSYRNVCGGCRARAYYYGSDILGDDPGCCNNSKLWDKIKGKDAQIWIHQ